jgi:PIN domain nuclease of toxin-antitoxin system
VVDLWYVIRTRQTFTDGQLGELVRLIHDPSSPLEAAPVTLEVVAAFQRIPGNALGDPWDRVTGATAMALELPLVTRDQRITELDLVETIW